MKGWVIKHLECVVAFEPHNIYESLSKEMDKVKDVFPGWAWCQKISLGGTRHFKMLTDKPEN